MEELAEWLPVKGWEPFYEVSSTGQVRSLDMSLTMKNNRVVFRKGRNLKAYTRGRGRLAVKLCRDGVSKTEFIHRLVAEAFIPNPQKLPIVRHLNDVNTDNRVENLAWGTQSDNMQDAIRNGKHPNSVRTHCAKGHPYTQENTRLTKKGYRRCVICMRAFDKKYRSKDYVKRKRE